MSALTEPGGIAVTREELAAEVVRLRGALSEIGRMPGAAAWLMDNPRAWEAARDCAAAEEEFWRLVRAANPDAYGQLPAGASAVPGVYERCAALSEEFAAMDEATSERGWG